MPDEDRVDFFHLLMAFKHSILCCLGLKAGVSTAISLKSAPRLPGQESPTVV